MIGAIVGDIVGSRFEFNNRKTKEFQLLVAPSEVGSDAVRTSRRIGKKPKSLCEVLLMRGSLMSSEVKSNLPSERYCFFTDDTVMTLAIAEAIMKWRRECGDSYEKLSAFVTTSMRSFGRMYPHAGYGGHFARWLWDPNQKPYNSWGNGAAMRVSACGWAGGTLEEVKRLSEAVTGVTHNHPEGLKGAEATAVAIYLARFGKSKEEIREMMVRDYYQIDFNLDDIRSDYHFDESCQGSVPQALEAFFESESFEDAIRNAISIGGDSDTLGAICGAVAGAYYGVPNEIRGKTMTFLSQHLIDVLRAAEDDLLFRR